jgi:hypothetical protein
MFFHLGFGWEFRINSYLVGLRINHLVIFLHTCSNPLTTLFPHLLLSCWSHDLTSIIGIDSARSYWWTECLPGTTHF